MGRASVEIEMAQPGLFVQAPPCGWPNVDRNVVADGGRLIGVFEDRLEKECGPAGRSGRSGMVTDRGCRCVAQQSHRGHRQGQNSLHANEYIHPAWFLNRVDALFTSGGIRDGVSGHVLQVQFDNSNQTRPTTRQAFNKIPAPYLENHEAWLCTHSTAWRTSSGALLRRSFCLMLAR